jgi:hypothetical protein
LKGRAKVKEESLVINERKGDRAIWPSGLLNDRRCLGIL